MTAPSDDEVRGGRDASVGAVVVAAGRGERLGGDRPKALVEVAGRALVAHAVAALRSAGIVHLVVVHTPGERTAFADAVDDGDVRWVVGGDDRSASVRAGLAALPDGIEVVAVHDAARAFVPPALVAEVVEAVTGDVVAAAPALPVADTLKRVDGQEVVGTVDRAGLVAVQTPQAFRAGVLRTVVAARPVATDDLALVEAAVADGRVAGRVVWLPGSPRALKVTYPDDLLVAEALAAAPS